MELNWPLISLHNGQYPLWICQFYKDKGKKSSKIANFLDSYIFHDFQKSKHSFCRRVSEFSSMQTFLEIKNAECNLKVYYH